MTWVQFPSTTYMYIHICVCAYIFIYYIYLCMWFQCCRGRDRQILGLTGQIAEFSWQVWSQWEILSKKKKMNYTKETTLKLSPWSHTCVLAYTQTSIHNICIQICTYILYIHMLKIIANRVFARSMNLLLEGKVKAWAGVLCTVSFSSVWNSIANVSNLHFAKQAGGPMLSLD